VAAITGGARGFGRAAAELFASEGASVVIGDVLDDLGKEVAAGISKKGGKATYVHTDVTSSRDMENLVQTAVKTFGKLDVMVANAGILIPAKVEEFTEEQYQKQMDVNVKGVWLACKYAIPALRRNKGGSIVITASGAALRGSKMSALYAASKGAVLLLMKSVALQLAPEGIRCNAVCPGPVATDLYRLGGITPEQYEKMAAPMVPMGKLGEPKDIAYAMLFYASDESKYCTGSLLSADGGFTA